MKNLAKASFKEWQVLPPLSLPSALSCWEGENPPLPLRKRKTDGCPEIAGKIESRQPLFLFPEGENQGDGVKTKLSANSSKDHD
jgi:hypothetical protein